MVGFGSVAAQNNRFTERSFVPSPRVRAMGDAGVALPGPDRPFFYNPAHLPYISSYFTVGGVSASASRNMREQIRFFNERIQPAVKSDFKGDSETLEELYRETFRLARHPVRGSAAVVFPSFVYSEGGIGVGGGLFAKTALNYRVSGSQLGVPELYLLSRTDIMAVLSLGMDLGMIGLPGLSVGGVLSRGRRFLAFENKPLDTFTPNETAVSLVGNAVQVDVGGLYTPPWWGLPGRLRIGGAVYDVLDQQYDYVVGDAPRVPFLKGVFGGATPDSADGTQEIDRTRQRFRLHSSYRIGVAYQLASVLGLEDVGLALDYQGYGSARRHPLTQVHAGLRAAVSDGVILRGGVSSGYPTGGIGIHLWGVRIDYAVHAFEEGRAPGERGTYVHTLRVLLRIQ
ncbi:MAG: hypothetical protein ABEK84_04365 [Salinibacter sp.]